MATYSQIQERVKHTDDFVPKTCWIADIKNNHGLTRTIAPNRISTTKRKHPCPTKKRGAIESAFKYFGMI